jgi:hypothetical protein
MTPTKQNAVLEHLMNTGKITGYQAWTLYGLYRLSSAINRLRNDGWLITTTMVKKDDLTYAEYHLDRKNPRNPHLSPDAPPLPPFKPMAMF